MAAGDIINYSKYKSMYSEAWRYTNQFCDESFTLYINAPSFVIEAQVTTVPFRSNWVNITAYYWNGSSWTQAYAPRDMNGYTAYASSTGSSTWKGYHNRAAEGTTSGDNHQIHLWKIDVTMKGKDGSAHGYLTVYCGGMELMTESEYNSYFKGNFMKYSSGDRYKKGNSYASDDAFIAGQKPSTFRGTPISVSSGTANKLCYSSVN